jgi:hypothetical protein
MANMLDNPPPQIRYRSASGTTPTLKERRGVLQLGELSHHGRRGNPGRPAERGRAGHAERALAAADPERQAVELPSLAHDKGGRFRGRGAVRPRRFTNTVAPGLGPRGPLASARSEVVRGSHRGLHGRSVRCARIPRRSISSQHLQFIREGPLVTIDSSGKWWVGSKVDDTKDYLRAYKAEGYAVHEVRICKCDCGSDQFELEADRDEGCAQRICARCGAAHLICDSDKYWSDAQPERWGCTECRCKTCNLAVGFSLSTPEEGRTSDVRWISVGSRCTNCGVLGSFVDWKVGYGPSHHLLEQA